MDDQGRPWRGRAPAGAAAVRRVFVAALAALLAVLVLAAYRPATGQAAFHLDDHRNIADNPAVHLREPRLEGLAA
ncbi:hypothetical protein EDC57_2532, partial [Inmirania thermothiophila]